MAHVIHFSSKRGDWQTPPEFLELVRRVGPIEFDPCTAPDNPTEARYFRTPDDCGLRCEWPSSGLVYCNPPYGPFLSGKLDPDKEVWRKNRETGEREHIGTGTGWARRITQHEGECLALIPARTDTRWFDRFVGWADWICLWKGRLRFVGAEHTAPFPSVAAYRGPRAGIFVREFAPKGHLLPGRRTLAKGL